MSVKSEIESLLFVSSRPLSAKRLAEATGHSKKEVEEALAALASEYDAREASGVMLLRNGDEVQLATAADNAELVKTFLKDESFGELTRPALETLDPHIDAVEVVAIAGNEQKGRIVARRSAILNTADDRHVPIVFGGPLEKIVQPDTKSARGGVQPIARLEVHAVDTLEQEQAVYDAVDRDAPAEVAVGIGGDVRHGSALRASRGALHGLIRASRARADEQQRCEDPPQHSWPRVLPAPKTDDRGAARGAC